MLDIWSFFDLSSLVLLLLSIQKIMNESKDQLDRILYIFTGAILMMSIVFLLRSSFLPFARFVGGIALIFLNLIPFFIVSMVFLSVFVYIFRTERRQKECWDLNLFDESSSLLSTAYLILHNFILFPVERQSITQQRYLIQRV